MQEQFYLRKKTSAKFSDIVKITDQKVSKSTPIFLQFVFLFPPSFRDCIRYRDAVPKDSICYQSMKDFHVVKSMKIERLERSLKLFDKFLTIFESYGDGYLNEFLYDLLKRQFTGK